MLLKRQVHIQTHAPKEAVLQRHAHASKEEYIKTHASKEVYIKTHAPKEEVKRQSYRGTHMLLTRNISRQMLLKRYTCS